MGNTLAPLVLLTAGLAIGFPVVSFAGEIRIGGTGNALGTMARLGEAYMTVHPETKVTVFPSMGTSGAIRAVPKGGVEVGLSSRPLTEEERSTGLTDQEYARSPTVFAVSARAAVTGVTTQEVEDIYRGTRLTWADGTTIRPVLRQANDDNTRQLIGLSPAMGPAVAAAEKRAGLAFATTDQEAADKLESIPGGFGVTTLALILSEGRGLKALTLDGTAPTLEAMTSGRYPLVKRFFLILPAHPSPEVEDFVRFLGSAQAKAVLRKFGQTAP